MDLGEALYRAVTGGRSPATEKAGTLAGALAVLVRAAGGNVSEAARLAGVPRRSMRDWLSGKSRPKPERAAGIMGAARRTERRQRLKAGREKRLRRADAAGVTLAGYYNYDGEDGQRDKVEVGRYLRDNAINDLIDAYLAGASLDDLRTGFAANIDQSDFYAQSMARPQSDPHGWTVTNVNLEGGQ